MNNKWIQIMLTTCVLWVVVFALGCGGGQNTNTNTNANAGQNQNAMSSDNANVATELAADPCSDANIDQRRVKVDQKILDKIKADADLYKQYQAGLFKYQVAIGAGIPGNYLDLYIGGSVIGKDQFVSLIGIVKAFVKSKCTQNVFFVKLDALPISANSAGGDDGFLWSSCDYPTIPCPNGECQETCKKDTGNTNSNSGKGQTGNAPNSNPRSMPSNSNSIKGNASP